MKKHIIGIIIAVLCVSLAAAGVTIGVLLRERNETPKPPVYGENGRPVEGEIEKNEKVISAPGYEMLELKADTASQGFALANPVQNNCYMKISITLADGSVLWTSKSTAPGEATDEVVLSPTLEAGRYEGANIIYACFRNEACTEELNSVVIDLYLLAK